MRHTMDLKHDNGRLKLKRSALLLMPLPRVFVPSHGRVVTLDRPDVDVDWG